jgi:trans-2,3-dihydro-3-hydroxyanthranilate isomerase
MRRRFVTLDVFTGRRFAGNPLAVVLDAEGLDGKAMQAIAREFNLAETVFVLPPQDPAHRARLRIFTPAVEMPFAGHPTVGTAVLLNRIDGGAACEFVLEEGIGPIACTTTSLDRERGRARFQLVRLPEELGDAADTGAIAAALGIPRDEIGCDAFRPSLWSAGISFTFVPVGSLDAIRRCEPSSNTGKTRSHGMAAVPPMCSAARPSRPVPRSMPACSRRASASMRTRRPDRPLPPLRAPSCASHRRARATTTSSSSRDMNWDDRA